MLIRSQNKEVLATFENLLDVEISGGVISARKDHGWYCDNCRFSSEIKESDSDDWNCDECHRKYNRWGISMNESNKIAKEILNRLGE